MQVLIIVFRQSAIMNDLIIVFSQNFDMIKIMSYHDLDLLSVHKISYIKNNYMEGSGSATIK